MPLALTVPEREICVYFLKSTPRKRIHSTPQAYEFLESSNAFHPNLLPTHLDWEWIKCSPPDVSELQIPVFLPTGYATKD